MNDREKYPYKLGPVDQVAFGKFWDKVYDMACQEFGIDEDGDARVTIQLLDRSRFWPLHYMPVRYEHKVATIEELDKEMSTHFTNLGLAMDSLQTHLRTRQYEIRRIEKQNDAKKDAKK